MLRPAGSSPPVENTPNPRPNPLVELPFPPAEIVADVDLCIVTHLHSDHFDEAAAEALPHDLPVLTQPESAAALRDLGFANVATTHPQVAMTRGRHGTGELGERLGPVSGWVVDRTYVAGDTIWCDEVESAIAKHEPHTIVVNAGGARFLTGDPIVMDTRDVGQVRSTTTARIVVVHLEAINHCLELRADVRAAVPEALVPEDGETLEL